ncbi:hypothetical protein ILUMI_03854 [Ignelater luminosus]|uniref:Uncharacterized protein n=1 Tax=Ignelater luminosus TaxID=2038154 RepID=A0A8K0DA06_IGNLU|nr:hypothetical protein ILUMI_03854 [Ignelater luminosus]
MLERNLMDRGKNMCRKKAIELKEPCNCRKKCYEVVNEEQRKKLFEDFYSLSRGSQDQDLAETIKETEEGRKRIQTTKRRFNEKSQVCQTMYLHTFDLAMKKLRVIVKKNRDSESITCPIDGQGQHCKHKRIEQVIIFENVPQRNNITPEKKSQYRKIFNEEFNLSFHTLANVTCTKRDRFKLSLKALEEKQLIEEQNNQKLKLLTKREHLDFAEAVYKIKSLDKERSKKDLTFVGRNLKEIHHRFMEPDHSHMEADTIHAASEIAKKKTIAKVEVSQDWNNCTVRKRQDGMEISFPNPITLEALPTADIKVSNLSDLLPYISE